ncbi:MAG TPA: hypothetical protein VFB36_01620, partial [Nevskiaceae bacterium]|nr:hypothetical protein [Nevskiaceae bacterium]
VPQLSAEIRALQDKLQSTSSALVTERDESSRRIATLQSEVDHAAEAEELHKRAIKELEAQIKDEHHNHEIAIEHLHRTQAELETLVLTLAENARRVAELTKLAADAQQECGRIAHEREEVAKLAAGRQGEIERLLQARDAEAKLAAQRTLEIATLTKQAEELARAIASAQAEHAKLAKARDEQAQLVSARQAEVAQLIQIRNEQTKQLADRERQLIVASTERDQLAARLRDTEAIVSSQKAQAVGSEQLDKLAAQIRDLQRDNEASLLQLHQAREELELATVAGEERLQLLQDYARASAEIAAAVQNTDPVKPSTERDAPHQHLATLRGLLPKLRGVVIASPTPVALVEVPGSASAGGAPFKCAAASLQFARMSDEYWQISVSATNLQSGDLQIYSVQALLEWYRGEFLLKLRPSECGFELDYFRTHPLSHDDWGSYLQIALADTAAFVDGLSAPDRRVMRLVTLVLAEALRADRGLGAQTATVREELAIAAKQCQQLADDLSDRKPKVTSTAGKARESRQKRVLPRK